MRGQGHSAAFPRWPFVLLASALTLAGAAFFAIPLVETIMAGRPTQAPSEPPPPVRATVGGVTLAVPRDFVRFDHEKHDVDLPRLDLLFRWPSLEAVRDAPSPPRPGLRPEAEALGSLIFLSITPKDEALDPERRFSGIYQRFLETDLRTAPSGLAARRFVAGSGYDGEELFYDPARPASYFVRCAGPTGDAPATCLREMRLAGKLDVVYRFPRPLLGDWRRIEQAVQALIAAIGVPAG